jgi:predicted O-methyltransferase YrrM
VAPRLLWQLRALLKRMIPVPLLNEALLALPVLYRTPLVNFETNISQDGIRDLLDILQETIGFPGDVIECGSSRCGASIIMANYLLARGSSKHIIACDSFEGFDQEELRKEREKGLTKTGLRDCTSTSFTYVRNKVDALGLTNTVIPVKGFFSQTLLLLQGPFSFALIDCDLQDSLVFCAETLWPRLVSGGRIAFDDYLDSDFKGARKGVDTFVARHTNEIVEHGMKRRLYVVAKR